MSVEGTGAPISPTDAVTDVRGSRAGEQVGETESLPFSTPNHRLQPTPYSVPTLRARLQAQRSCAKQKLGASCRAQVPAEEGLTSHSYMVHLLRRYKPNEPGAASTGHHGDRQGDRTPEACSSPASAAQADGDGLNAPEASTKAACW